MRLLLGREIEVSRWLTQVIPCQWQGVGSESDHEARALVGSVVIAALRAKRARPSVLREEESGIILKTRTRIRNVMIWRVMRSILFSFKKSDNQCFCGFIRENLEVDCNEGLQNGQALKDLEKKKKIDGFQL